MSENESLIGHDVLPDGIYMDDNGELLVLDGVNFTSTTPAGDEVTFRMDALPLGKFILLTVMLNNAEYLGEV